jgi:hypothetical protein
MPSHLTPKKKKKGLKSKVPMAPKKKPNNMMVADYIRRLNERRRGRFFVN